MSDQKEVPLLSASQAIKALGELDNFYYQGAGATMSALLAIGEGHAVVIPRAELEAKDARIAELESCLAASEPVAWTLRFDGCTSINPPTTFETETKANLYADECAEPDACNPSPVRPAVVPLYLATPTQNLDCKTVQKRLATQWGYIKADETAVPDGVSLISNEALAALYLKSSGKTQHASDCATSCAPALTPGSCDCYTPADAQVPDEQLQRKALWLIAALSGKPAAGDPQ